MATRMIQAPTTEGAALDRRLKSNVADWASRPWAIHRARLTAMSRRAESFDFSASRPKGFGEDGQESLTATETPDPYVIAEGGVAVIEIVGDIWKEVPWIYAYSGCAATSTLEVRAALDMAQEDPRVSSILLRIDSPGGVMDGVQELANVIFAARAEGRKDISAYIEDLGASAAYWIGSQASRVTANQTATIGSIGVFSVILDDSEQSAKEGLTWHVLRSGPFKATGAGDAVTDAQLAPKQENIDLLAQMFAGDIARGRGMSEEDALELATGRTWIGPAAMELRLIDKVESLDAAILAAASGNNGAGPLPAGSSTSVKEESSMGSEEGTQAAPALTREEIAGSYPEAVESWRAEGEEKGREAGKTEASENLKALSEALPGRPEAVLEAALEGKSPVEAKAALADKLTAENVELGKKIETLTSAGSGADAVSGSIPPAAGSGESDFVAQAKALRDEKGGSLKDAMSSLAKENPDLFAAYKAGLGKK